MAKLTVKTGFHRPHDRARFGTTGELVDHRTGEVFRPPARTKQEFVAECDINNVLKQYKQTGMIRHISARAAQGAYTDLPDPMEFQDSMNLVIAAQQAFATLPAKVRDRFGNDPAQFLSFMADPGNKDEAVKLGLMKRPEAPPPSPPQEPPKSPETPPTA